MNATDCVFCNNHEEVQAFLLNSKLKPIGHSLEHIMMRECNRRNIELVRNLVDVHVEAIDVTVSLIIVLRIGTDTETEWSTSEYMHNFKECGNCNAVV